MNERTVLVVDDESAIRDMLRMALEDHREKGSILTGLVYMDKDSRDLHDVLETSQRPLNTLTEGDLCPGNQMLENINASLR